MNNQREELKDEYHYPNSVVYKKNDEIEELRRNLNTCKNDYWVMTNLLENCIQDRDQAVKDCIERMKFRKPLFDILKLNEDENNKGEK